MPDEHDDEDKSIVDALSTLGWVEEKDDDEDPFKEKDGTLVEQLNLFKEQISQLNQQITSKTM